ncbi:MAG: hypothetical protein AAFZ63_20635 [Bacteroidota bacterium]
MSGHIPDYRERTRVLLDFLFGPNDPVILQKDIVQWLKNKNHKVTEAALSNFKKEFQAEDIKITIRRIKRYFKLLEQFVTEGLGYSFDQNIFQYVSGENPYLVTVPGNNADLAAFLRQFRQLHYHPGRLLLNGKALLIQNAKQEVIELGTRLQGFTSYFNSQSDAAFQKHFEEALARGVNIKCGLLNPDSEAAQPYFAHRAAFDTGELHSIAIIRAVIEDLKSLQFQLNQSSESGKMELFTYDHPPYNHFFAVDRQRPDGVIIISSYLYGLKRAKSPVLIVTKQADPILFDIYNSSLEMILNRVKKIS